jgi:hypothetical protein
MDHSLGLHTVPSACTNTFLSAQRGEGPGTLGFSLLFFCGLFGRQLLWAPAWQEMARDKTDTSLLLCSLHKTS